MNTRRNLVASGALIAVVCLCPQWASAQLNEQPPEWQVLFDARPYVESAEGRVFSVGGVVNTPPLLPEQTGAASATWHDPVRDGTVPMVRVSVLVYTMANPQAASGFFEDRPFAGGWTVETYSLGDQATLTTLSGSLRQGIQFRKGRFLVLVDGDFRDEVDRIARHVLRAIPAAQPVVAPDGGQGR